MKIAEPVGPKAVFDTFDAQFKPPSRTINVQHSVGSKPKSPVLPQLRASSTAPPAPAALSDLWVKTSCVDLGRVRIMSERVGLEKENTAALWSVGNALIISDRRLAASLLLVLKCQRPWDCLAIEGNPPRAQFENHISTEYLNLHS